MVCCLCTTIKKWINRYCDCCYKIENIDESKLNQSTLYCAYPYCPGNYSVKDCLKITIKFRGNYYCNKHCLNMHKSTNYYSPDVYVNGSPFDYAEPFDYADL